MIKTCKKKASIVYNPDTKVDDIEEFFPYIDQVLIMSVHPGFGGQKFIESSLSKGRFIREKIDKAKLDIDIEIDGGVNFDNAGIIKKAGFNVLVSGNTIFKSSDIHKAIEYLKNI